MKKLADEKGLSLMEFSKKAEKDKKIDAYLDEELKKLAKQENDSVITTRTGCHLIPESIKIFVKCDLDITAGRLLKDVKEEKRKTESEIKTKEDALKLVKKRLESEKKRYKKYYGINYLAEENYDFIIDTTGLTPEESVKRVMNFIIEKISTS